MKTQNILAAAIGFVAGYAIFSRQNDSAVGKPKIEIPDFFEARISTGTYNTQGYRKKIYTSKQGLSKGLSALKYPYSEAWQGAEWNLHGTQYKLSFSY